MSDDLLWNFALEVEDGEPSIPLLPPLLTFHHFSLLHTELQRHILSLLSRRAFLALGCTDKANYDLILDPSFWALSLAWKGDRTVQLHKLIHSLFFKIDNYEEDERWLPRLQYSCVYVLFHDKLTWNQQGKMRDFCAKIGVFNTLEKARQYLLHVPRNNFFGFSFVLQDLTSNYPELAEPNEIREVFHWALERTSPYVPHTVLRALACVGDKEVLPYLFKDYPPWDLIEEMEKKLGGAEFVVAHMLKLNESPEFISSHASEIFLSLATKEDVSKSLRGYGMKKADKRALIELFRSSTWPRDSAVLISLCERFGGSETDGTSELLWDLAKERSLSAEVTCLLLALCLDCQVIGRKEVEAFSEFLLPIYPYPGLPEWFTEEMRRAVCAHVNDLWRFHADTSPAWLLEKEVRRRDDADDLQRFYDEPDWDDLLVKIMELAPPGTREIKYSTPAELYKQGSGPWKAIVFVFEDGTNVRIDVSPYGRYCRTLVSDVYMTYEDNPTEEEQGWFEIIREIGQRVGLVMLESFKLSFDVPDLCSRRFSQERRRALEEYLFYWED